MSERVRLTGKSGYSHHIDFLFPEIKKRKVPERALQVVNNPQKDSFARVLMIKNDLQMRNLDVFMIINDQRGRGNMVSDLVNASHEYDIEPILWSKRDEMSHALFA